jgi:threonine/homoserine efflux transporter RhtA
MNFLVVVMRAMTHFNVGALLATLAWLIWVAYLMAPNEATNHTLQIHTETASTQRCCALKADPTSRSSLTHATHAAHQRQAQEAQP